MPTTGAEPDGLRLETARQLLRPLTRADLEAEVALLSDWDVVRYTSRVPYPYTLDPAEAGLAELEERQAAGREIVLAVTDRRDGALLGVVGLEIDRETRAGVIGFWLGRSHWGRGIATEAVDAMLGLAF